MTSGIKGKKNLCILFQNCVYIFSNRKLFACTFLAKFRGKGRKFFSFMRNIAMEYAHASYNHEYEFRGLHLNMGNVET